MDISKIKNGCAVIAAMIPMLPLIINGYSTQGLIIYIACIIGAGLTLLKNYSQEERSILKKLGALVFFSIISYMGIIMSWYGNFTVDNIKLTYISTAGIVTIAASIVVIIIASKRKHLLLSRLLIYFAVMTISLIVLNFVIDIKDNKEILFPLIVTIIFFFTDYIGTSCCEYVKGIEIGFSYHCLLAIGVNLAYAYLFCVYKHSYVLKYIAFENIPKNVILIAMAGSLIMILICAVFRNESTLNASEPVLFLGIASMGAICLVLKENSKICILVLLAAAIVNMQFVIFDSNGSITSALRSKLKVNVFVQNAILLIITAASAYMNHSGYNVTSYLFAALILVLILISALNSELQKEIIACGTAFLIYAVRLLMLWEHRKLTLNMFLMTLLFIVITGLLITPSCRLNRVLIKMDKTFKDEGMSEDVSDTRFFKKIMMWFNIGVTWIFAYLVSINIEDI